jgi:hypothetical protein
MGVSGRQRFTLATVAWWLGRVMPRSARRSYQISNEALPDRWERDQTLSSGFAGETTAVRFYRHWNPTDKLHELPADCSWLRCNRRGEREHAGSTVFFGAMRCGLGRWCLRAFSEARFHINVPVLVFPGICRCHETEARVSGPDAGTLGRCGLTNFGAHSWESIH